VAIDVAGAQDTKHPDIVQLTLDQDLNVAGCDPRNIGIRKSDTHLVSYAYAAFLADKDVTPSLLSQQYFSNRCIAVRLASGNNLNNSTPAPVLQDNHPSLYAAFSFENITGNTIQGAGNNATTLTASTISRVPGVIGDALKGPATLTSSIPASGKSLSFYINLPASSGEYLRIGESGSNFALEIGPDSAPNVHAYHGTHILTRYNGDYAGRYGSWQHVYFEHVSGAAKLYINGTKVQESTVTFSDTSSLKISLPSNATLDQFRVFSATLTASEVSALASEVSN